MEVTLALLGGYSLFFVGVWKFLMYFTIPPWRKPVPVPKVVFSNITSDSDHRGLV